MDGGQSGQPEADPTGQVDKDGSDGMRPQPLALVLDGVPIVHHGTDMLRDPRDEEKVGEGEGSAGEIQTGSGGAALGEGIGETGRKRDAVDAEDGRETDREMRVPVRRQDVATLVPDVGMHEVAPEHELVDAEPGCGRARDERRHAQKRGGVDEEPGGHVGCAG